MADIPKPIPEPDEASKPFWDGSLEGKFMLMRCNSCEAWRMPSRSHCDRCLSNEFRWEQASGNGTVWSFGVMHQKYHPAFYDDLPYNLAVVQLAEGPRLTTNIIGIPNDQIRTGLPVEVTWESHSDVALPKFRPVTSR